MAQQYADRAFISVNGARFADVETSSLRRNFNSRTVKTMTPDGNAAGFVKGNNEYDIDVKIAVQNQLSRPKMESIDYENNDVQLTYICGADQYSCLGLFPKNVDDDAPGVGDEAKCDFKFGCLKVIDTVGNSVLFNIAL